VCGDALANVAAGEACDFGGDAALCDGDCTLVSCGDGYANAAAGEICDTEGDSATCNADCSPASCGDAYTNGAAGEECDDAGDSEECDSDCTFSECGDSHANEAAGEECDTGGNSATCDSDCTARACGDGFVNEAGGEACDTSGESASCDSDCTAVTCGDGHVNTAAGETCDGQAGCNSGTCKWDPVTINIQQSQLVGFTTTNFCSDNSDRRTQNTDWGFNWTDPGIPFTPSSITVQFGGALSCNPISRTTSLNGSSTGNYTPWNDCNCVGTSAKTFQLQSASAYNVGGANQFRVQGGANIVYLDTGTSGWPGNAYARVTLNP
jgi:hypothetical protein